MCVNLKRAKFSEIFFPHLGPQIDVGDRIKPHRLFTTSIYCEGVKKILWFISKESKPSDYSTSLSFFLKFNFFPIRVDHEMRA